MFTLPSADMALVLVAMRQLQTGFLLRLHHSMFHRHNLQNMEVYFFPGLSPVHRHWNFQRRSGSTTYARAMNFKFFP